MVNWKSFVEKMLVPGTAPCALFGALVGLVFAVLCLTIGVPKALLIGAFCLIGAFIGGVKDKAEFVRRVVRFVHRDGSERYE